ncbi:hemin uptake protein HemP [Kosakonia cowanii]|uniref:hemin uptake protein HemP n=1 Tax=Kosakonia cowanii TaxID=208223 RepID=UPI0023FA4816|nr:hemin uptake protein HemP [Kosakonia cowanii]MDF7760842.1 hemin uptake protein HemP [Kosakonia cowanii]
MILIVDLSLSATLTMDSPATPTSPHEKPNHIHESDRLITSQALLGEQRRIVIEHNGQRYLLRETHAGKLILTK